MILMPIVLDISTSPRIIPSRLCHVRISTKLRSIFKISIRYFSNHSRLGILHICFHHRLQKAARHLPISFQITAFKKDAKLVPIEPRNKVFRPTSRHHRVGNLNQQRVPDIMAIGVIHSLELIQIHINRSVGFTPFLAVYPIHQVPARLRRSQIVKINITRELGVRQARAVNKAAYFPTLHAIALKHVK